MTDPAPPYSVSAALCARDDFRVACEARDFQTIFRMMKKYDGASQDRISSPVPGLTQSRVSRVMSGESHIMSLGLIERIAEHLHIPGAFFGLTPRPWEAEAAPAEKRMLAALVGIGDRHRATAYAATAAPAQPTANLPAEAGSPPAPREAPGDVVDRNLTIEIDVAHDGWATLTYRHDLFNGSATPFTRLNRELWFETTSGPLAIDALPDPDRNIIIQRIHDTALNARFACQLFPAVQPGESAIVGYRCTGGRFVYDHYWRQSIVRPTSGLLIRLRHNGITALTRCTATEDRPDGSEVSATESLSWRRDESGVLIELSRRDLRPNQFVTLRWDTLREPA